MNRQSHSGVTLMELLAVLGIIGALTILIVPRINGGTEDAKREACFLNQAEIELQSQLWRRSAGAFPPADLSGIRSNSAYFPEDLPTCPVDGLPYTIDPNTGLVVGHSH